MCIVLYIYYAHLVHLHDSGKFIHACIHARASCINPTLDCESPCISILCVQFNLIIQHLVYPTHEEQIDACGQINEGPLYMSIYNIIMNGSTLDTMNLSPDI